TSYGLLTVDGQGVICEGPACPELTAPKAVMRVVGAPDAAALVPGEAVNFPNGTPVDGLTPMDAVVYARPGQEDVGLQPLLNGRQPQVDENDKGDADAHSSQRCPNGAGGERNTETYRSNLPTPGTENYCPADDAPDVIDFSPDRNASGVAVGTTLTIEFSEPMIVEGKWVTWVCDQSGTHTYRARGGPTLFTVEPNTPMAHSESCTITVVPTLVSDLDADDPPDNMARKKSWSFTTAAPPADFVVINEIDPDTPGTDVAEFIELYDGGVGQTPLDGLSLVFYNGSTNLTYRAIDLDGMKTDAAGHFVAGNAAVNPGVEIANGTLQNGPDGVALYMADASEFPFDSPIREQGLIDAVVYGDPTAVSPELLALLATGQSPVDEDGRGAADLHALQRCPDGAGGPRHTDGYLPSPPTPAAANSCITDDPPVLVDGQPEDGAAGISIYSGLSLTFSESVVLAPGAVSLSCEAGGVRALTAAGGPTMFNFAPTQPLLANDTCRVHVTASLVADSDTDDPPDRPVSDFNWSFTTGAPPPDFVLINETDADTPGSDIAEFIELYDGGSGNTDLTGLTLVLYNGHDDRAYHAVDLDGLRTNEAGYLVIGNSGVVGSAANLPNGILQNGTDAVALYAGDATAFPNGMNLHTDGLLDAVVYGTDDPVDAGLSALLLAGEAQVNEAGRDASDLHSSGRCPDGAGGRRRTATIRQGLPSPGVANHCLSDDAPEVIGLDPADGATGVALDGVLAITFSEAVVVGPGWQELTVNRAACIPPSRVADRSGLR
ncbi:MAG TPA: Ig-like domain-containing protein, partial [Promineifilum sp.]|nr:Ig-like domain-containing protein [Promineifilum sp.]